MWREVSLQKHFVTAEKNASRLAEYPAFGYPAILLSDASLIKTEPVLFKIVPMYLQYVYGFCFHSELVLLAQKPDIFSDDSILCGDTD